MDQTFLAKLACPITHSPLHVEGDFLVSQQGGIRYPIKDGLPVLLPDAAILPEGTTREGLCAMQQPKPV